MFAGTEMFISNTIWDSSYSYKLKSHYRHDFHYAAVTLVLHLSRSGEKPAMDDDVDLRALVSSQHHELLAATVAESDHDLAYRLQLQEALAASLSGHPASSAPPPLPPPSPSPSPIEMHAIELGRFLQEESDADLSRAEMDLVRRDLRLLAHDAKFAREIQDVPDEEWERDGDNIARPIGFLDGEGAEDEEPFSLYFKGLASEEAPELAAMGVAIHDPHGKVVLKIQRLVPPAGKRILDATALLEGLQAAHSIGITHLNVYIHAVAIYNHVMGKWVNKQRNLATVIGQAHLVQRKLKMCNIHLLPRSQIQFVIKLARDVIDSHIMQGIERNVNQQMKETCSICLEETDCGSMFTIDNCNHRFCFSCMRNHVEFQLFDGILPDCPHEDCKVKLDVESSKKFLTPKLSRIMASRLQEASIPATEKVYCPYPKCSALMTRRDAIFVDLGSSSTQLSKETSGARKCVKCSNVFCISCKVPWHVGMSCSDYQIFLPLARPDDAKLQALARSRLWRQCVQCNEMIELAEGCYHMTCSIFSRLQQIDSTS